MHPNTDPIIALPGFRQTWIEGFPGGVRLGVEYVDPVCCPHCSGKRLWIKDSFIRVVRHESIGTRQCFLHLKSHKYLCLACRSFFRPRYVGIKPHQRVTERFRDEVTRKHHQGHCQSTLASELRIGAATVERWYQQNLATKINELSMRHCPRVMGIDEHFFTRKKGFATTLADLAQNKVFDVTLGRSESSLAGYLTRLRGKEKVRVMLMDLSTTYRTVVRTYFPRALIVADRFHVVRLVNHAFLKTWASIDPQIKWNRGLLSLVRRHPKNLKEDQAQRLQKYLNEHLALKALYDFKIELMEVVLARCSTRRQARPLVLRLLSMIKMLEDSPFANLKVLGKTLDDWKEEIARMWRFSKTNSILEGLHNKMEVIARRAYGFKSFSNYRIRVLASCGY